MSQKAECGVRSAKTLAARPWVQVRPLGWQPGCGSMPGRMLYNVVGSSVALSTRTIESLLEEGYRVEVVQ